MKNSPKESTTDAYSSHFTATPPSLFFTKNDPSDPRLGDFVRSTDEQSPIQITLQGYPDDEGISLNGGRPGAKEAPLKIREFFYKLTPQWQTPFTLEDAGDLLGKNLSLLKRHEEAQTRLTSFFKKGRKIISLGGGHDYGYPDAAAFLNSFAQNKSQQRPLVINIDAHLDVRPFTGVPHSGTPFRRLFESHAGQFDFLEIGIQPHCSSLSHHQWVKEQGGHVLPIERVEKEGLIASFQKILSEAKIPLQNQATWLSVDIDGFHQNEAPGCSQSWVRGLRFTEYLSFFHFLFQKTDMRGLGIYEVSPPLDLDHRTSKLAALIMYEFLREIVEQGSKK